MKTNTILVLAVVSLFIITIFANNSDAFFIGANVYNKATHPLSFHTSISEYMLQAGFNAGVCTAVDIPDSVGVINMVDEMNRKYLDGILEDYIFDPANQIYGARTLSGGNYYRFEAEYHDATTINENDRNKIDSYFYMSSDADSARVGSSEGPVTGFSNDYFWQVDNGQVGYAYHDLTYKWLKEGENIYYRVGQEFRFPFKGLKPDTTDSYFYDNELYITFAVKVEDISTLPNNTVLADIRFTNKGLSTSITDSTVVLHFAPGTNGHDVTQITKEMYTNSPIDLTYNNHLITCRIPFPILNHANYHAIIDQGSKWDKLLVNLNPTLYWYGNGTLKLDYIEFKDKLYEEYTDDDSVLSSMVSKRTFGQPYLYGMNEPGPGQFESFRRISRYLETIQDTIEMITPVHRFNKEVVRADGSRFSNRKAYYETVKPKVFTINEYPFTKDTSNPNWIDTTLTSFVQNYIDNVCNEYKTYKELCGNNTRFFAVPQTWGKWDANSQHWDFLFPPDKVVKSLQLLPLCYDADGIISSSFFSRNTPSQGYSTYGLMNMFGTENLYPTPQYQAVKAANQKIKIYGSFELKRGARFVVEPGGELAYIGSHSIGVFNSYTKIEQSGGLPRFDR